MKDLYINFTYDGDVLGSVDDTYLKLQPRSLNMTAINAHLYASSPLVSASISAELLQNGCFPLNYTGIALVKYLGLRVHKKIAGTKFARIRFETTSPPNMR